MELCRLENITKTYISAEGSTCPIEGLNLSIHAGTFILISGESGIGKSTLLLLIAGLLKPTSGTIYYNDKDLYVHTEKEISDIRGNQVGYIFQQPQFVQALTVRENLELVKSRHTNSSYSVESVIQLLGLQSLEGHLPHQLSGGQKRRLMVGVTLLKSPQIILADEPTNDLDEHWEQIIMNLLKKEAESGKAVLLVTHSKKWYNLADQKYVIKEKLLEEF